MVELDPRRRRPAVSCSLCRRRKIRCNREQPCSNCLRGNRSEACVYESPIIPRTSQRPPGLAYPTQPILAGSAIVGRASTTNGSSLPTLVNSSLATSPSSASSQPSGQDAAQSLRLKARIKQLEHQLYRATLAPIPSRASTPSSIVTETTNSSLGGTFHVHRESTSSQPHGIARSLTHKTRFLGQSHWEVNGVLLIRDLLEVIEPTLRDVTSDAWSGMEKCKILARNIKAQKAPPWPTTPTSNLPLKDVTDKLVDCYLRTTESVYRILHIPTFQRDYEALWVSNTVPDTAFLVQLKLVLAIGAVTYDENFSLRVSALRWVYEAQVWASEPFKLRLDVASLQTDILLLLALERVGVGGNLMWISVGAVLRKAFYMGLHRDPDRLVNPRTILAAEIRRRLWNTILELSLQSSLTSGGAPLISLGDFDTAPPGNFNDNQLTADDGVSEAADTFTQVSIALALRTSYPHRLAVVKFLNDLTSVGSYAETLRLDADLRAAYKALREDLRACNSSTASPSMLEISAVDFLMHRYLSSLHIPYFGPALSETTYAFSRRVVIDSSLQIWRAAYPSSFPLAANEEGEANPNCDDMPRLVRCSSGFYPVVAIHAAFLISIEIRTQLQEDEGLGPVPLRPDLLSVVEDAKTWCKQVIKSGETNIKGYLLMNMVSTQIEGLKRGLGKEEVAKLLIATIEDVGKTCLPMLQEMMAAMPAEVAVEGLEEVPMSVSTDKMEEWSFMTSDPLINSGNDEVMNWMFDDDFNPGVSKLWDGKCYEIDLKKYIEI